MPALVAPLEKEFKLTPKGISPTDPIVVKFKQAREADNIARQEMLSRPITRSWEEAGYAEKVQVSVFGRRMAIDVYLSLFACNLVDQNDKPVFTFKEKTLEDFMVKWGMLPPEWAEAIYEACLRVNPVWGGMPDDEEVDEEPLTLGEEEAGQEPV